MSQEPTNATHRRRDALAAGVLFYFTGKPCRNGHLGLRHVSWGCVACHQAKNKARAGRGVQKERDSRRKATGDHPERNARRRAGQRCPSWVRSDPALVQEMREVYAQAQQMGEGWHVDHVVPLVGKNTMGEHVVSGLHVPWNLRVVPADQNIAKGSSFDTDAPLEAQGGYGRNQ